MATTEQAEPRHVIVRGAAAGFTQKIQIGSHQLEADEPVSFGGTDAGRSRISPSRFDTPGSTQLTARIARRKKERSIESSSMFSSPVRSLANSARNLWKSPSAVRFI